MLTNSTAITDTTNRTIDSITPWPHPSPSVMYHPQSLSYEGKTKDIF
jgi:hypothetical protein